MTYTAIDCQGFAGGFTLGVVQAGFKLIGKREMKGGFGVPNCEVNRHLLGDAWQTEAVNPEEWSVPHGGADLVFGNPPCSGFSVLSSKNFRGVDSKINACMWAFTEYVARVRPQVAVFESVPLAYSQGGDLMRALRARLEDLTSESWALHHVLHNAYSIGGPAMRKRYFWVVSRVPFGVERPQLSRVPLFRDVISDLIDLPETWARQPYRRPPTWYSERQWRPTGVDGHIAIDNPHTRRTRELLDSVDWFPGEHSQKVTQRYFDENGCLPPSWSHLEEKLKGQAFFQGFNTPTMWNPDNPARVITGAGLLNGVHWQLRRTFTHRETARILGFPDDWLIEPLRGKPGLFLTWGKGITVDCGRWIAGWVRDALNGSPGAYVGDQIGSSEFLIDVTSDWKQTCGSVLPVKTTLRGRSTVTEVAVLEGTTTEATEGRRGRPRPQETQERDQQVLAVLTEPLTRGAVAAALGIEEKLAYLSLYRLRRDGLVERTRANGAHVWSRISA